MDSQKKLAKQYKIVSEPLKHLFQTTLQSSYDSEEFLRQIFPDLDIQEHFYMLMLNRKHAITGYAHISSGGIKGTVVDPLIIAKYAVDSLSVGVILCHNHPSGNLKPSQADIKLTEKVNLALHLFDIVLLDHIILTEDSYTSFADEGLLTTPDMSSLKEKVIITPPPAAPQATRTPVDCVKCGGSAMEFTDIHSSVITCYDCGHTHKK